MIRPMNSGADKNGHSLKKQMYLIISHNEPESRRSQHWSKWKKYIPRQEYMSCSGFQYVELSSLISQVNFGGAASDKNPSGQ